GSELSISLEENEDPVTVGEDIVYKLNIENTGPDDADSVTVTCSLPQGLVLRKDTISGYESSHVGNTLVCKIPLLPADSSLIWTISFSTLETGRISFSAEVEGRVFDPDPSNNKVTETTEISLLTHEKIAGTHNFGMDLSFNGTVHLAYIKNDSLCYSCRNKYSGWTHEKIGFGGEYWEYDYCDIVTDRSGRVHIVQSQRISIIPDSSVFYLYHYIKDSNDWDKKLIGINHKGFYFLDIELAADDELQLAYIGFAPLSGDDMPVMYMKTTNQNWGPPQIVGEGYDNVSLAIDSKDNPHLSFYCIQDFNTRGILYSTKESTDEWDIPEVMDPDWYGGQLEGMRTSIQLDQQDNPHISFVGNDPDYGAESMKVGIKDGEEWIFSVVDSGYYISGANAVAIDPYGHDHIFYATRFYTHGPQMRYAYKYSDTWIRQIINDKHFAQYATIKMDREGNLHMAYIEFDMELHDTYLHYVMRPPLPIIITDTNRIDFGCANPGEIIEKTISITNPGSKRVYIDKLNVLGSYPYKVNTEHPFLDPGETDSVKISFEPESLGMANTALRIWFNGTEKMFIDIELLARTSMPILQLDYERTRFDAPVGGSDTCYFYVSNKGDLPLEISNVEVVRKFGSTVIPTDFDLFSHDCSTLGPGDSCVIVIAFSPDEDNYQPTSLYIYSNDFANPDLKLELSGYIAYPSIKANTYDLDFGYVLVGTSTQKDIIIRNAGKETLDIYSFEIEGENFQEFSISHNCSSLEPDDSCIVTVEFHPLVSGDFEAQIISESNSKYGMNIQLEGSTLNREIAIVPDAIAFDIIRLGNDTMTIIEVTNSGEALIEDISMHIGVNALEFSHTAIIETLQIGETFTDTVKFSPLYEGLKLAEWIIEYDNGLPTADTVPLSGIGLGEPHPLIISAGAEPFNGMIPLEVNFYATATGGSLSYNFSWDFGDGYSDSSEDPVHTYQQPGKYWASVNVSDDQENNSADSVQILVGADLVPVVKIYAYQEIRGSLLDVQFTSEILGGRNPLSVLWDFGDGTSSIVQNPQHSYVTEGEYQVNFLLTDGLGTTASDSILISFTLPKFPLSGNAFSMDSTLTITAGTAELFISGQTEPVAAFNISGTNPYTFDNLDVGNYTIRFIPDTITFP
ncbi:MAG: choice-of-anchor D domain-containing protein, partial [Bacteroidales bacterium]|nr:choice-of-anchor D domain-containing protein [Bacteroidales bacterium]